MLAINTEQQQHTLLTRFTPIDPGDPALDMKIGGILADVDRVLPAVGLLADKGRDDNQPEHATSAERSSAKW